MLSNFQQYSRLPGKNVNMMCLSVVIEGVLYLRLLFYILIFAKYSRDFQDLCLRLKSRGIRQ